MRFIICLIVGFISFQSFGQEEKLDSNRFWKRVFLPSIDAGYQFSNANLINNSIKIGTSIEFRYRNNNDVFLRLNYDTYGAEYNLLQSNNTTNSISGTVQFTDFLIAPGYRFGDKTYRMMFAVGPGWKMYDFPVGEINETDILISQDRRSVFTTSFMTALEYYFDEKSAITFTVYQNQVWDNVDFWEDHGGAWGFSLGFITSLM